MTKVVFFWAASSTIALTTLLVPLSCGGGATNLANPGDTNDAGASTHDPTPPTFPTTGEPLPCDVDEVFAQHCRECHTNPPLYGALMPLQFRDNLIAPARSDASKKVYELVGARIHDDAHPMPQPPKARLSAADMKTLDDWIAQGAPAATSCAADAGASTPDSGGPPTLSCTPDTHVVPGAKWAMPTTTDDVYVCYGFDVTPAMKRHVVGITPRIGNKTIVHHVLLFESDSAMSATPTACNPGDAFKSRMIYAWAPGGQAMELPSEAGFPEQGTTHYLVQVHYSNLNHVAGQTDDTGFDLCTTDKLRANDADVLAFGTMKFTIPAHGSLDITCNLQLPAMANGVHVFTAFPHMHKLGKTIATTLVPGAGGAPIDLGKQMSWDFNTQLWFPITATVANGDTIETRCAWNNPSDQAVSFGTSTTEEMCYSFTAYYPKIQSPVWSWALPANASTCAATP
jgi:hypothetical protein